MFARRPRTAIWARYQGAQIGRLLVYVTGRPNRPRVAAGGADESPDRPACPVFEPAADGHGGEPNGEVGFRVPQMAAGRAGLQDRVRLQDRPKDSRNGRS